MPIDVPSITFTIVPAQQLAGVTEQRTLIVGQKLAAGSATSGVVISELPNDGTEDTLCGQFSQIADMVREFKKINRKMVKLN